METAKVKLVTIVAGSELEPRLEAELKHHGAVGYTSTRVEGRGVHGVRKEGILDTGNVRIESLVSPEIAHKLLQRLAREYADWPFIAFAQDVEAVPRERFE
ncbi:MAG: transcriptional regulator [Polyangiaceae bacterium]